MVYYPSGILFSNKRIDILLHATTGIHLKRMMLSDKSQIKMNE